MMALMATAGVFSSCSNDNEPQPEESAQNPSIEQVKQVWNEVGQEMKSVDPAPLNQLLTALNDKGTKMTTRTVDEETGAEGEETEVSADMINDLKEMLTSILYIDGDEPGLKHSLSFVNIQNTFALLYEFQQIYLKQEGEYPSEGTATIDGLGITVIPNDTTKYDIVLARKNQYLNFEMGEIANVIKYSLVIEKNDANFLEITTYKVLGLYESEGEEIWDKMRMGTIKYMEHELSIFFAKTTSEPTWVNLNYAKNGSDLIDIWLEISHNSIAIPYVPGRHSVDYTVTLMGGLVTLDGRINRVSTLVANAAAIGLTYKNGTTETACVKLVNDFNDNFTANIAFSGTDMGDILLGYRPVEGSVNYKPVIVVSSPLFGDTPLTFDEILASMGMTWDDIKGMIGGM